MKSERTPKMLKMLEDAGQLDNTLVVVTSDNGLPFPRAKGHIYEDGYRLPLAIRWPGVVKPNRTVEDFIRFDDLAPTFLEAVGLKPLREMTGRSFINTLRSESSGWIDRRRDHVVVGKERHDIGRPGDAGYPVRAIRTREFLYARNFTPATSADRTWLVQAKNDLIVGPGPVAALAAAWGAELATYASGHITVMNAPGIAREIRDHALRAREHVEPVLQHAG